MVRKLAVAIGKRILTLLGVAAATLLVVRIYDSQRGPPLEVWHTHVPHELSAGELDHADWNDYLAAEEKIFETLRAEVSGRLSPEERVPVNRYFVDSPVYPGRFAQDWNRSYTLEPGGAPVGAAVLLHGLTDSPYSLRHLARHYRERGFVVIAIRLPAHGTTPGALTDIEWESWAAATRLAAREAVRRTAPASPLHIVGFSNGGSLALKYALDAIDDSGLKQASRIVLISPMVGITRFARFAGWAGLPAVFPAFAKAAWLSVLPEFNPFKYNSFPVNGARQSYRLTQALQEQLARDEREGKLNGLPPILTFQSVMDFTVSTPAVLSALYAHLPANGSEIVLFDLNRNVKFGPLLRPAADAKLSRIAPAGVRPFRLTTVVNAGDEDDRVVARTVEAGAETESVRALDAAFPPGVFSLSHVALPFPLTDSLYGLTPDRSEDFGIHLGALAPRGERNTLIVSMDALLRMSSNPFFAYMIARIDEGLPAATDPAPAKVLAPAVVAPAKPEERGRRKKARQQ